MILIGYLGRLFWKKFSDKLQYKQKKIHDLGEKCQTCPMQSEILVQSLYLCCLVRTVQRWILDNLPVQSYKEALQCFTGCTDEKLLIAICHYITTRDNSRQGF